MLLKSFPFFTTILFFSLNMSEYLLILFSERKNKPFHRGQKELEINLIIFSVNAVKFWECFVAKKQQNYTENKLHINNSKLFRY